MAAPVTFRKLCLIIIAVLPCLRLKFKFRRGTLPPMMPLEFVGCIGGCDETLREVLDLKYLRGGGGGGGGGGRGPGDASGRNGGGGNNPPRPPRPQPPRAPNSNPRPSLPPVPAWNPEPRAPPADSSDAIVCNCGQDALLLTVRKDGPNQGRQFYKCNSGTCNFFLWADQPSQQSRGPPLSAQRAAQPSRPSLGFGNLSGGNRGSDSGVAGHVGQTMCNCNDMAVTRTVQKDGPNKGRMFHTCGKPRDQQCGFFQWADENAPPPGTSGGGFNAGGDGGKKGRKAMGEGAANRPPAVKKPRSCGICHMPGHTRVTCPQR